MSQPLGQSPSDLDFLFVLERHFDETVLVFSNSIAVGRQRVNKQLGAGWSVEILPDNWLSMEQFVL